MKKRISRGCEERYCRYIIPDDTMSPFFVAGDELIVDAYSQPEPGQITALIYAKSLNRTGIAQFESVVGTLVSRDDDIIRLSFLNKEPSTMEISPNSVERMFKVVEMRRKEL